MRARRGAPSFHEPSLVPMADMLTNTVGVVLFILIFTVLTAGGAVMTKRLPMERPTTAKPLPFLCAFGRIRPMDADPAVEEFLKPLGRSVDATWVARFRERKVETAGFTVSGEFGNGILLTLRPKPNGGETAAELAAATSQFRSQLAAVDPQQRYVSFAVFPDGITTFRAARDFASANGFSANWTLFGAEETLRVCIGFCPSGGGNRVQ